MTTAPETDDKKEELQTEKKELEQDIKETKEEAQAARDKGDTERAEQLEAQIQKVVAGELAGIKAQLEQLANRPFHPAPEADKPAATEAGAAEGDKDQDQGDDKPKERKHRFGSTRWFGDRAYED
jgi:chromosome segregation ATPase